MIMLVDKVQIKVVAGRGGNGSASFRREKYVPKGGPDGGNGGKGGDVYISGLNDIRLLRKFREKPLIKAEDGTGGGQRKKSGKNAPDTVIKVPYGTLITNLKTGENFEVMDSRELHLLARGGSGGRGNWEFRSATNQAPTYAEPGKPGEEADYILELRLIADIGLIGLPNAGKSTLLNVLTSAHAKVANYPFTTLEPNLGTFGEHIVADIPGLIEGASQGKGLGIRFLRHVERTKLLVHCLSCESADPIKDYQVIRKEIGEYNQKILERPEVVVFTKYDVLDGPALKEFVKKTRTITPEPILISVLDDNSIARLGRILEKKLPQTPYRKSRTSR